MPSLDNPLLFGRAPRRLPRRSLRRFAERLRTTVAGGRQFSCLLTGDGELRRLNRDFLGKDYATDVLSFPSGMCAKEAILGDIAISTERAAAQAREYGHGIEAEVGILMLHGLLHLLGMDHESDRGKMLRREIAWRKKLGLPASVIERVHA